MTVGVLARYFRVNLDIVERAGYATVEIERALFPGGIDPDARYPWAFYAELSERIGALIGSPEAILEAYAPWPASSPGLKDAFAQVSDPLEVARMMNTQWSNVLPSATFFRVLDSRTYEYGYDIPAPLAGSLWGAHISAGLLAGQPLLIGLPRAHVAVLEITARRCHFRVTLPPQRAVATSGALSPEAAVRVAALVTGLAKETTREREEAAVLRARCASFGAALSLADEAEDAAVRAVRFLATDLPAPYVFLWAATGRVSKLLAHTGERTGESHVLPLLTGGERVGDLEIPRETDPFSVANVLPLLATTLARLLAAPRGWQLTEAEERVCELLARGESNKGIAQMLGLAVATVEEHVSSILRKSGARRRTEVLARWREEGGTTS